MKTIDTGGISRIEPIPHGTADWYYGISREQGDLCEAEELYRAGREIVGNRLCFLHYPDGQVFEPVPRESGRCLSEPVFFEGGVFFLNVDFPSSILRILRFDCASHAVESAAELPLSSVRDCYNLGLDTSPLTLRRQGGADGLFEILWPERVSFPLGSHESFFLRDGNSLYFNRWHEEGEGADYRYWEETVVRDLTGELTGILPGDLTVMPNGEIWHLR